MHAVDDDRGNRQDGEFRMFRVEEDVVRGVHELAPRLVVGVGAGRHAVRVPREARAELGGSIERREVRPHAAAAVADAQVDAIVAVAVRREGPVNRIPITTAADGRDDGSVGLGDADKARVVIALDEVVGDAALEEHVALVGIGRGASHRVGRAVVGIARPGHGGKTRARDDHAADGRVVGRVERPRELLLVQPRHSLADAGREHHYRGRRDLTHELFRHLHMVSPVDERIIPNSAAETQGLRKLPRNLHPCQCIHVADDLRSGDIRKVPRKVPRWCCKHDKIGQT